MRLGNLTTGLGSHKHSGECAILGHSAIARGKSSGEILREAGSYLREPGSAGSYRDSLLYNELKLDTLAGRPI